MRPYAWFILVPIAIQAGLYIGKQEEARAAQPLPVRCRELPTEIVRWGLSIQDTKDGLYLCFQQGGANQGMTEITCVPMEACR